MFYPPLTFRGSGVISGGIKPQPCHWAGWRQQHVLALVLQLSSLVSGSFLSGALTAAVDNKMMECGRLIHRHIPCCSADSKMLSQGFFSIDKVLIAFWLLFIWTVCVCVCQWRPAGPIQATEEHNTYPCSHGRAYIHVFDYRTLPSLSFSTPISPSPFPVSSFLLPLCFPIELFFQLFFFLKFLSYHWFHCLFLFQQRLVSFISALLSVFFF